MAKEREGFALVWRTRLVGHSLSEPLLRALAWMGYIHHLGVPEHRPAPRPTVLPPYLVSPHQLKIKLLALEFPTRLGHCAGTSAGPLLPQGGVLRVLRVRASVLVLVFWPAGSVPAAAMVVIPGPAVSGLVLLQADLHGGASLGLKALELFRIVQQQQLGDGQGQASRGRTG